MNKIQIIDKVFKTEPQVISNCSADEFSSYVSKIVKDFSLGDNFRGVGVVICRENKEGTMNRFIWIHKLKRDPESIATLSHELFHLVLRVMDDKGVPVSSTLKVDNTIWNGDEAASYLYEFYMHECLKKIFTNKQYK